MSNRHAREKNVRARIADGTWQPPPAPKKPPPTHPLIPGVRVVMAADIARGLKRNEAKKLHDIRLRPPKMGSKRAAQARAEALYRVLYEE